MPGYQHSERAPARPASDGGTTDRRSAASQDRVETGGGIVAAMDRNPSSQSHVQLRTALDRSPRIEAQAGLQRALNTAPVQREPNNTGLPDQLRDGIESLSGLAMDDVRVHYNSAKPATVQAHAYAQGTDIHIAPGQEKHLPHEAWHVVQQKQGRVKPTLQLKGVAINDDAGLEREADAMGGKATGLGHAGSSWTSRNRSPMQQNRSSIVQRAALIVGDDEAPAVNQIGQTDFLNALRRSIVEVADKILGEIGNTSADCPYIPYWFNYYQSKSPQQLEKALEKYAPGALSSGSWEQCIRIIVEKVRQAFQENVKSGSMAGVPDELPKDLEQTAPVKVSVSPHQGVTQLCSSDVKESNGDKKQSGGDRKESGQAKEDVDEGVREYQALQRRVQQALPNWGNAQLLGYKGVYGSRLEDLVRTGAYPASDQTDQLGPGVYVAENRLFAQTYGLVADGIILEVGYAGNTGNWTRLVAGPGESAEALLNRWTDEDVLVQGAGMSVQHCYKIGAAHGIALNNFRYKVWGLE